MSRPILKALLLLLQALLVASASTVRLYAAHSDGNVTSLALSNNNNNYSLAITSRTAECRNNPSVLTLDKANNVLYCYDRGSVNDTTGSLNSFALASADDSTGALTPIDRIPAPYGGVWGEILTATEGRNRSYIAASYNTSAISVFALDDAGIFPNASGPDQTIFPPAPVPAGPVPGRQDRSYVHHVIIDPTNTYILVPDLGADRIRVFTYDPDTIAPLVEVGALMTEEAAVGPRHGAFRVNDAGETFLVFNGELSQKVYSYKVTYGEDGAGLTFEKVFEAPALGDDSVLAPTTAPTSECLISPDGRFVIVSNREKSFASSSIYQTGPSDTLSTWAINEDGTLTFVQNAPSGGWSPRQLSLNKAGDMVAVGHQNNNTVVVWKRNVDTGLIVSEADGGKLGEAVLTGAVVSTIWDE